MARLRSNFQRGSLSANAGSGDTSLSAPEFSALPVVASPDYLMIVLDPDAVHGNPEIVKVTAHTSSATTVTVTRAQESTSARSHNSSTTWRHVPTKKDWDFVDAVYNVMEFGAVGDNSTDDSTAINNAAAAIRAAGATGNVALFLPPLSFKCASALDLTTISNLVVWAPGATINISGTAASGAYWMKLGNHSTTTRYSNVAIYGLKLGLSRAPSATTNSGMLSCRYIDDLVLDGTNVTAADVLGYHFISCTSVRVLGPKIGSLSAGVAQILGDGMFFDSSSDVTIVAPQGGSRDDVIFHQRTDGSLDTNFHVVGADISYSEIGAGIRVQSCNGVNIQGTVRNTGSQGIDCSEDSGSSLKGCQNVKIDALIIDAGQNPAAVAVPRDGINCVGSDHVEVNANIRNPYRHGYNGDKGSATSGAAGIDHKVRINVEADADDGNNVGGYGVLLTNLARSTVAADVFNTANEGALVQNTQSGDTRGLNVTVRGHNIKKSGGAGVHPVVYFTHSSTGRHRASMLKAVGTDSRAGPVTDYLYRVDSGDDVEIDPTCKSYDAIPVTDSTRTNTLTRVRTAGNLTINTNGAWTDVDTALDLTIDGKAGDKVELIPSGYWGNEAVFGNLNAVTRVSAADVHYITAETWGVTGWIGPANGAQTPISGGFVYTLASNDIDANGQVTFRWRAATQSAANKTLYGGSDLGLTVTARNLGPS